eukprot:TRINITY_DN39605_c0_g1_i1.p1 TRINITY_DN39605_c0_g1~~TRINITY_DN39605_c0_g1_i1.p1  ORF type:complete len:231 (-),score=28.37 TRINITY_DN39605_c0_g1_i1:460-1152(-)
MACARARAWSEVGTTLEPGSRRKPSKNVSLKEVLQGVRALVAAADLLGALEVLDNLVSHVDVDKPLLEKEHWKNMSWPVRKQKALALVGADPAGGATAMTHAVTSSKPGPFGGSSSGFAKELLPQLALGRNNGRSEGGTPSSSRTEYEHVTGSSSRAHSTSVTRTSGATATARSVMANRATAATESSGVAMPRAATARRTTAMFLAADADKDACAASTCARHVRGIQVAA